MVTLLIVLGSVSSILGFILFLMGIYSIIVELSSWANLNNSKDHIPHNTKAVVYGYCSVFLVFVGFAMLILSVMIDK